MVGIAYSDPELAIQGGLDYFNQEEENIVVCPVFYPSGVEYLLKKERDVINGTEVLIRYKLTEDHQFSVFDNAMKALTYFKKLGKKLCVKKKTEVKDGYKFVKYYYLCSI